MNLCIECGADLDTAHYYNGAGPYCGRCAEEIAGRDRRGAVVDAD
jgi:hypothetical protein